MAKSSRPGKFNPLRRRRWSRDLMPTAPTTNPDRPDDEFGGGAAGVREPRRPGPGPFSAEAEADEPVEQYVDATSLRR
ncbi:hypothetical protein [Flindersiella endophytica]